jgi:uncharacterized surface protein with fasciclin (FAS1) repeats
MEMVRRFVLSGLVAGLLGVAVAAPAATASGDRLPSTGNIVEVVVKTSGAPGTFDRNPYDYDILREAVLAAKLEGVLSGPGPFTVFAPDDAAFRRTARDLKLDIGSGSEQEVLGAIAGAVGGKLATVLTYHVAPGNLGPFEVLFSGSIATAANESFRVRGLQLVDNQPTLPNPYLNLFALDIPASNGVIHGITRVLRPGAL